MARFARIVIPGLPHHVTQRGNRREPIFFEDGDQEVYRDLLAEQCARAGVECWAYCLMPNHVHLVLTPRTPEGLGRAVGEAHRRYTNFINARGRWSGHLFQSRFSSVAMDDGHLSAALAYVSLNPVRARLVERAEDWVWASTRAYLRGRDDGLVTVRPGVERGWDFATLLRDAQINVAGSEAAYEALRRSEGSGWPVGTAEFVADLERRPRRPIARRSPGRKPARPVKAGLVERAEDWRWSSTRAQVSGREDGLVKVEPVLARTGDFSAFLGQREGAPATAALRASRGKGRPVGATEWLAKLEADSGRTLVPEKRGPKPKPAVDGDQPGLFRTVSP